MSDTAATDEECRPVSVSRRIAAPAHTVFAVLADPARHVEVDGADMLRGPKANGRISGVGDTFVMRMHNDEMGDYEMTNHVVEFEPERRIAWEPVLTAATRPEDLEELGERAGHRWGFVLEPDGPHATVVTETFDCSVAPEWLRTVLKNGTRWLPVMTATLERLDHLVTEELAASA